MVWAIGNSIGSDSPACFWDPATNTYSFEDQGHTGISIQAANVLVGVNGYVELNGSDLGDSYILRLKPADNLLGGAFYGVSIENDSGDSKGVRANR